MKHVEMPIAWIILSCVIATPLAFLPAFADNATSTSIISSQNPSTFGQSVTITAAVNPSNATGIIFFNDTSTVPPTILNVSTISGGLATFSSSSLSVGSHDVVAIYVGDTNYLPSTSVVLAQTVNKVNTTTLVTSSVNPSAFGQLVNFTATVTPVSGTMTPTGTIQFLVNGTVAGGPIPLINGQAEFDSSSLSVGSHLISAIYSGDAIFVSSSGLLTQTIHQVNTSLSLTSSQNPSTFGQSVTLTAIAFPRSATGSVQFNDTSVSPPVILGTSTLSGGNATLSTTSLSVGSHTIVALYLGDTNNIPTTSNIITQTINSKSTSSISLSANSTSIISGGVVLLTTVISPNSATGTIQFQINGTNLGAPVTLSGGQAILSTSSLPIGIDVVSALYSGNDSFEPSTSNSVTISVTTLSQNTTANKIEGEGKLGKGIGFEFSIDPKDGNLKGRMNYHDKTSHFNLHSTKITSLSVDSSMTQISFTGQAKTKGGPHDISTGQLTFSINITDINKKGKQSQFSIIVTDGSGKVVYQNSATATGHIKIHKEKPEKPHASSQTSNEDDDSKQDNKHTSNANLTSMELPQHKEPSKNHESN